MNALSLHIWELDRLIKEAEAQKTQAKKDFFRAASMTVNMTSTIPQRRVEIEKEWFTKMEITEDEFLETRFPSWELVDRKEHFGLVVFLLKKDIDYMPYTFTNVDLGKTLGKQIQEYDPTIDWASLHKDNPEVFYIIAKEVTFYELDEEALHDLLQTNPEVLELLSRHMLYRKPAIKLSPFRSVK